MDMIVSGCTLQFRCCIIRWFSGRPSIKWAQERKVLLLAGWCWTESSAKPLRVKISDSFWPHVQREAMGKKWKRIAKCYMMLQCTATFFPRVELRNSATQGGRQLNILFGCIASLHRKKAREKWKKGCDEKTWLRNEWSVFLPGQISNSSKKNYVEKNGRSIEFFGNVHRKLHWKHEAHYGSKFLSYAEWIFLYLFLLSYSNPVHPHPAHTHIQFTGRFFSAADVLFRLAWRSASFHFGSKFYTLFVLKGPVEMPVRFSM